MPPQMRVGFPAIDARVTTGLGDDAAAVLLRHGVCVVAGWAGTGACESHLAAVEALLGALPRPRAPHWPPPKGWLHYPLVPAQREWLSAAGLPVAAAEPPGRKRRAAPWLLEGHGCHVGMAWAWRAEVLPWFQRWHAEPCVAAIEPVWVRVPRCAARPRVLASPFPPNNGGDSDVVLRCLSGPGAGEGEAPFAAGPPVPQGAPPPEPPRVADPALLTGLAWTRPTERPLCAHVVVSTVASYRFLEGIDEGTGGVELDVLQGDLVIWDPALWHLSGTHVGHPLDFRPGCALAHVLQPVACHPSRLEPNTVEERVRCVRTGRRPPLCPAGTDLYPLAASLAGLGPLTGTTSRTAAPRRPQDEDDPTTTAVKAEAEPVAMEVKLEEPELTQDELLMWHADGFLSRAAIERDPAYWDAVVRGSRVVEQADGSVFVEGAGVLSAPFTEQQQRQSKRWEVGDAGPVAAAHGHGEPAAPRRPKPPTNSSSRHATESARLEEDGGALDPTRLGWSGQLAEDVLNDAATARAVGLGLPPLRWGPRALGPRPWEQALRRLMPLCASRLPVVVEVTAAMQDAFEQCATGHPPELSANWATRLPLWRHNQAGRVTQILADDPGPGDGPAAATAADPLVTGAVLCPWGLPVAVFAGPREVARSCSERVRRGDPCAIEIEIPDSSEALDDAEAHVVAALGAAEAAGVSRAGAAVVLVLPSIRVPSALLAPDAGPVCALAVALSWVDPWLQAHMAHRLAAWCMACITPCIERRPVPFNTMAVPSRETIDHIAVTRTRQWQREPDRGASWLAAAACAAVGRLRLGVPASASGGPPPGPGAALLPTDQPFRPSRRWREFVPGLEPAAAVATRKRRRERDAWAACTADDVADGARAGVDRCPAQADGDGDDDQTAAPLLRHSTRRRRTVDPVRYSERKERERRETDLAEAVRRSGRATPIVPPPPVDVSSVL